MSRPTPFLILLLALSAGCDGPGTVAPAPVPPAAPVVLSNISLVPSPPEVPTGGGSAVIWVETSAGGGRVASRVSVELSASHGELSRSQIVTDETGHASVSWSGTESATITARSGNINGTTQLRVIVPAPTEPPSSPPPPRPGPAPGPTPNPNPGPEEPLVALIPERPSTPIGIDVTFSASVTRLAPGETVVAYEWDFDVDAGATTDAMTTASAIVRDYAAIGVYTVRVTARTSQQRSVTATTQIIVTN